MKKNFFQWAVLLSAAACFTLTSCGDDDNNDEEKNDSAQYVDLGLPSGTLWATCNVGATSPEESGDFFGWGETETKEVYNYPLYKWNSAAATPPVFSKYCTLESLGTVDNLTELELEDDAAYVNMGTEWRMPSTEQIKELISTNNTKSEWKRVNGVYGRTFTSLVNGDTIFIPAVGHRAGAAISFNEGDLLSGLYWTRSLVEENPETAWFLGLSSGSYGLASTGGTRFLGRPIRAVRR